MTIKEQFKSMTAAEHAAMKSKLLEIISSGKKKPKAGTLEGYALRKYFHMPRYRDPDLPAVHGIVLARLANNPLCYEQVECAEELERRRASPFDPRTEVSADAEKIIAHLWRIVLLPVVLSLLFAILYFHP